MTLVDQQKPQTILVVACIMSLGLAGVSARYSFFPVRHYYQTKVENSVANPTAVEDDAWTRQVAKRTGGDIKQLSPLELQRLNEITRGHADLALHVYANQL